MTVRENLSIPLKLKKTPKEEIINKINEISAMLSINKLYDRYRGHFQVVKNKELLWGGH